MVTNVWLIITGKREDGMMKKIIAFMLAGMLALGSATVDAAQFSDGAGSYSEAEERTSEAKESRRK